MQQDSEALDLKQALGVLRRRMLLIVLCIVLAGGAAYGYSKHQTKKYTATASIVFSDNSLSQQIAGLSTTGGGSSSSLTQQAANLELVKGSDVAAKTASVLGHGLTAEKVAGSVNVAGQGESGVIDISATSTSPTLAAEIANAYAHQFVNEQQSTNRQYFKSALALVNKQLDAIPPRQQFSGAAVELQNRAATLRLLSELQYGNVQVAQEALPPASASSPKTSRNAALGVVLGLLIAVGLAFILERFDRRIRGPEELEAIYRLPMLGTVPKSAALARSARDKDGKRAILPPIEAEAFSLIRAHLRFFNVDRDLRTVVIASAALGDGKSTIARHLAEAATRSGSRALLLEADLRHPTLAQQLDVQSGPGLADVLISAVPMSEATQAVELEAAPGQGSSGRTLDVLVAGTVLPPNPAELLESHAMSAVLEQAKSAYDLVVIDTPPLASISDGFSLLAKIDGVVVVGWVGRSERDAAKRLHQVLASSGAPLLGVIANGSKSGGSGDYAKGGWASPVVASPNGVSSSEELVPTIKA